MIYYSLKMTMEDRIRYITPNNKGQKVLSKSALFKNYASAEKKLKKCLTNDYYKRNAIFEIVKVKCLEVI